MKAANDALLAERDHGVEERRRDSLADDGHASSVDQQGGFHACGFSYGSRSVIASVVVPLFQISQSVSKFA